MSGPRTKSLHRGSYCLVNSRIIRTKYGGKLRIYCVRQLQLRDGVPYESLNNDFTQNWYQR